MSTTSIGPWGWREPFTPGTEDLRTEYAAYRVRQAYALVHLAPRDAIRPLYRAARAELPGSSDPMTALVRYLERRLPLPPFDVWLADRRANPEAYLEELAGSPDPPTASSPATVEGRTFRHDGREVRARLRAFRGDGAWRGFISFSDPGSERTCHTAVVFREADLSTLRERFLGFDTASLAAFLRSASA